MCEKTFLVFALFFMWFPPLFLCRFSHHENNDLRIFFYPEGKKTHILENNNNFCKNGGVLKSVEGRKECFCDGSEHYGPRCEFKCDIRKHEFIISEKCLTDPKQCKVPTSCIDTRVNLFVNRKKVEYPICNPLPEICMDMYNTFYVNRSVSETRIYKCENGGFLERLNHTSKCMCRGTGYFGSRCHIDCKTLGYIIPEKCLQGKECSIPSSCIDVSRKPKIYIDRCQNGGVLLIGKTKQMCNCYSTGFWGLYCTRPCLSRQPSWCKKNNCSNLYPAECLF